MAKLQLGRFPISKNGYVVLQFRITTLWCSIGCVQMAKLQGRFPISKIAYAVMLDLVNRACIHVSRVSFVSVFPSWCFRHLRQYRTTRSMIVSAEWCYGVSRIRLFKHTFWVMLALSIGMGVSCKRCTMFVLLMHISLHQPQRWRGCGSSR